MPSLYVGTYHKYNSGSIAGNWLDLEDYADPEDFYKACKELHSNESDPEFMFQDYEDLPASLYSESGGIAEIYTFLDLDEHERKIVEAYLSQETGDDFDAILAAYQGTYDSEEDYAIEYCDNTGILSDIPDFIAYHIDYKSMGRDLTADMTSIEYDGAIWFYAF